MEADLKALEDKLAQFVEWSQHLRTDNKQLRQQLAQAINDNKRLQEKVEAASGRLQNLARTLTGERVMAVAVKQIDFKILGREFRVACPEHEERQFLDTVAYVDRRMNEMRDKNKTIGLERTAIMTALAIANDLLNAKHPGELDLGEFRRRMNSMQSMIEAAMTEQEKLF